MPKMLIKQLITLSFMRYLPYDFICILSALRDKFVLGLQFF